LKKGGNVCKIESDGKGIYLSPYYKGNGSVEGDGIFFIKRWRNIFYAEC